MSANQEAALGLLLLVCIAGAVVGVFLVVDYFLPTAPLHIKALLTAQLTAVVALLSCSRD